MPGEGGHSLLDTPTWALATVCFIFISLGIFIEHLIHILARWLKKHRKNALIEAVERLKSGLMLLGFMSLILAVSERTISKICIPTRIATSMLPCHRSVATKTTKALGSRHFWGSSTDTFPNHSLIPHHERQLAADANFSSDNCSEGKTALMSPEGMNQLSIFIFVLAVMQIVYSVLTMGLGRAKMKHWKAWEKEIQTFEYQLANDPNRFRYARDTTFGRRHMGSCAKTSTQLSIKCFFRQFFRSVAKVDYLTLRHGFISAHISTSNSFNFQQYIQRSLEDDFKVVVRISPFMWLIVVIFLLVDVHGWHVYLWVSFLPLIIVLVLGTKLQVIVARMALQFTDRNIVIKGSPLVQPNDNLFWFSRPKFVLTLLHFTLFMNAFELAFFIWVTSQFGFKSCYHEHLEIIIIRVVLAVTVQVLCSYITLPLYALVSQMGSHFKRAALEEQTMHIIKQWHARVRDKRKKRPFSQSHTEESSTTVRSSSRITSPDLSSHHPTPTLAVDFSFRVVAAGTEIVEEYTESAGDGDRPPPIPPIELHVEIQDISEPSLGN